MLYAVRGWVAFQSERNLQDRPTLVYGLARFCAAAQAARGTWATLTLPLTDFEFAEVMEEEREAAAIRFTNQWRQAGSHLSEAVPDDERVHELQAQLYQHWSEVVLGMSEGHMDWSSEIQAELDKLIDEAERTLRHALEWGWHAGDLDAIFLEPRSRASRYRPTAGQTKRKPAEVDRWLTSYEALVDSAVEGYRRSLFHYTSALFCRLSLEEASAEPEVEELWPRVEAADARLRAILVPTKHCFHGRYPRDYFWFWGYPANSPQLELTLRKASLL